MLLLLYVSKQIFSKLYIQVNNSRILRIKSVEFLNYVLNEHKHVKGDYQIWNSVLSAFKSLLQILMKVIEKNLWHSYISIFGIYIDSKQSRLELRYAALKNLEILTKVLEINFMAGGVLRWRKTTCMVWAPKLDWILAKKSTINGFLLFAFIWFITFNK